MLGGIIQDDLMGGIMQKGCTCFHRPQDAALAFGPQRFLWDAFSLGNPTDERLRLMGIEGVHKDVPLDCRWIAGEEALQMSEAVFLITRWPKRRFDHLPCDDIEIEKPRERAMANILEFTPQHMARHHRQVRVKP